MTFDETLVQVRELLEREGRVAYRVLKRRFGIDDEYIEDLKADLIDAKRVAIDEDGKVLVWVGAAPILSAESRVLSPPQPLTPNLQPPITYTPAHLAERIRAVTVTDGERKTITALFADLKGSTALIEGLDPEEARTVIDPALQLMMDAVHQYDGYVAQALGDGIFALFGAPIAHEDHPQRAVYAALRMQEAMRRYAHGLRAKGYPPLLMRVGINTGEVVLRSIQKDALHADYVPVGHSTNLAARMEQLATPGTIVVSAYTHRLTDGYFAFKDLGPTQIKGVEEPLHIYEVQGLGQLRTRLQVSASRYGLTRFVGRHSEMEQLNRALAQAKAGHGQIVGTMGEPGLGKSRLFYEFKLLSLGGCLVLEAYSVSHGKATAYLPVIELLKSYFDIQAQDDERKRQEKVTGKVLRLDRSLEDTLPYLFALLGIEEQPSPLAQMDPQIRRRRTFEALKKLFLGESLNQPLVLIFEDLHWIDGETQGFLDTLSESVASAKLLLLTNYRPEYRHEWGQKTYYTQLRLAPLGKEEAEELLTFLLGNDVSLTALKQLILDKTQGTPFFMEEIVQELREQGVLRQDAAVGWVVTQPTTTLLQIPTTVQGILAARIDRLAPDEKALLQQLAVIGRQLPVSLIRQVIAQPEAELYRLLASLQRKEFLYEQPAFPESEYIFKHALTQDVAYGTVLQEQKKVLHERTGQAMEQLFHDRLGEHYDEIAHHYQRSGNMEKAIEYLHKAGQQAMQRSAFSEATRDLTTALELLKKLPNTRAVSEQELSLLVSLGVILSSTKGHGNPETENAYLRAHELCQQLGATSHLFPVLAGLRNIHHMRAEFLAARQLDEQLLSLALQERDLTHQLEAHRMLGMTLSFQGELTLARDHLEQGITLYDSLSLHSWTSSYFIANPGVVCRYYSAITLWALGYPDRALKRFHEAIALAQKLSHPPSLAFALLGLAWLHLHRREGVLAQERAEAALSLATDLGFLALTAITTIQRGWALAEQGRGEEGLPEIQRGFATYRTTGQEVTRPGFLGYLAEVYQSTGNFGEGLQVVEEGLAAIPKTEEHFYEAELYRLKGELLLQQARQQATGDGQQGSVTDP